MTLTRLQKATVGVIVALLLALVLNTGLIVLLSMKSSCQYSGAVGQDTCKAWVVP